MNELNISIVLGLSFACGSTANQQQAAVNGEVEGQQCESFLSAEYTRGVDGNHRICDVDADCASVKIDCTNTQCTAVHLEYLSEYDAPVDCDGYTGPEADYDCLPEYNLEIPTCNNGCCTSTVLVE